MGGCTRPQLWWTTSTPSPEFGLPAAVVGFPGAVARSRRWSGVVGKARRGMLARSRTPRCRRWGVAAAGSHSLSPCVRRWGRARLVAGGAASSRKLAAAGRRCPSWNPRASDLGGGRWGSRVPVLSATLPVGRGGACGKPSGREVEQGRGWMFLVVPSGRGVAVGTAAEGGGTAAAFRPAGGVANWRHSRCRVESERETRR